MEASAFFQKIGAAADADIPLAETALQLSADDRAGLDIGRYRHHLDDIAKDVGSRFSALIEAGAADDAATRIAALKHIISDQYKYEGDHDDFHDLKNADLAQVIDRKKGLPITLSIIAIQAAREQNWQLEGVNFPGHFLLRMTHEGERLIADPFENFQLLQAPDLRALLKKIAGPDAELSSTYYETATNRDILVRLQNNIKFRLISDEEYSAALKISKRLLLIAPGEHRLLFDSAVLEARTGHISDAIRLLEQYLKSAPVNADRYDAQMFLASLRDGQKS